MISDGSYIDVFETQSSLSTAIAKSSFSQTEVEASVSGGAFGISAGVSAGFSQNESEAVSKSTDVSTKSMNVSYNFPRVILHLDPESVTLSKDCKTHIEQLKKSNSVDKLIDFHKKYGHFFATRIELGGRLYSSQESSSIGGADATEKATAMKAAASLAISSSFVQASASASHEKQKADNEAVNTNKFKASISWEAQGGDTLLCNNPAAWCSTVASYYNWRVIKQEGVEALGAFIGKIPGFSEVPNLFERIEEQTRRKETVTFQLQSSNSNESDRYLVMSKEGNFRIGSQLASDLSYSGSDNDNDAKLDYIRARQFSAATTQASRLQAMIHRTVDLKSSAWMGTKVDHSFFQVKQVDTQMDRPPRLQFGTRYRLSQQGTDRWLSATRKCPPIDKSYLFSGEEADATYVIFYRAGQTTGAGIINHGDEVEMVIYDPDEQWQGLAASTSKGAITGDSWSLKTQHNILYFIFKYKR
jgi:hypothetical protein